METCPCQPLFEGMPPCFSTLDLKTFNGHTGGLDSRGKIHHFRNHGARFFFPHQRSCSARGTLSVKEKNPPYLQR